MKKLFLLTFAILFITNFSFGQSKGSCSILLCNKVKESDRGNTNLENVFTGFTSKAVGVEEEFVVYIRFQNYGLNQVHTYYVSLEDDATGEKLINTQQRKSSFSMLTKQAMHTYQGGWKVNFPKEGVYRIRVYVDDKEEESLYLRVGD